MSIIFAILLFSFLIFIHELGHFLTAKAFGIQVNEFALFMGPAIWKKQVGETLYSIRCIPIGGYCAMEGEDEETDNPRAFNKAAWWKRIIVLVAGAFMNLVTGIVLIAIVLAPMKLENVLQVNSFEEWSTLDDHGLQVGDEIIEIDGNEIYLYSDFSLLMAVNPGQTHDLVVLRDGKEVELKNFTMETHEVTLEDGTKTEKYGVTFGIRELTAGMKVERIWDTTRFFVRNVRLSLQMLLTGQAGMGDMMGPVGIVGTMNDVAAASPTFLDALLNMLYLGALIAVNLAVMNLLPIPALDGGRVALLLVTTVVEAITGKKIDPKYEGYIHGAFMVLLLGLMAVILFKDIFTIIMG